MQALILDGTPPSHPSATHVVQLLTGELGRGGYACHHTVLRDLLTSPCRGEFRCWIETPGICVIRDEGRTVARQFITAPGGWAGGHTASDRSWYTALTVWGRNIPTGGEPRPYVVTGRIAPCRTPGSANPRHRSRLASCVDSGED